MCRLLMAEAVGAEVLEEGEDQVDRAGYAAKFAARVSHVEILVFPGVKRVICRRDARVRKGK